MLIYSTQITPRLEYIFKFIFTDILSIPVEFTADQQSYFAYSEPKINYSEDFMEDGAWIVPSGLLFENDITEQNLKVTDWQKYKIFFQVDQGDFSFDIFSAAFFLISRYEEYLPFVPDKHGRFTSSQSIAGRNNFLGEPLVDQWALMLAQLIKTVYPAFIFPEKTYTYIPTIDVDMAYCYLSKGWLRYIAGHTRDKLRGNFRGVFERVIVLMHKRKDPFDKFDYINDCFEKQKITPVYFFQVGKYGKYDKNIFVKKERFRQLIFNLSKEYPVGIHPSYRSYYDYAELEWEINSLKQIIGQSVVKSRQHFLKLSLPDSYRKLIETGIREDYSMGYAELPGFRAGTCTPFMFYDLVEEKQTQLKIIPFQVMDATFSEYLNLSKEKIIFEIDKIKNKVKEVNGTFVAIFHNNSENLDLIEGIESPK